MGVEMIDVLGEHMGMYNKKGYDVKEVSRSYISQSGDYFSQTSSRSYAGRSESYC